MINFYTPTETAREMQNQKKKKEDCVLVYLQRNRSIIPFVNDSIELWANRKIYKNPQYNKKKRIGSERERGGERETEKAIRKWKKRLPTKLLH